MDSLFSLAGAIAGAFENKRIRKANTRNRGVIYYKPTQIYNFIEPKIYNKNLVCSGDSHELRSELITSVCAAATNAGIPVVILHKGDQVLDNMLQHMYANHPQLIRAGVGPGTRCFDPLFQLPYDRIGKIIVDTADDKYRLTSNAEAYIQAVVEFRKASNKRVSVKALFDCPHTNLPALLGKARNNQVITQAVFQDLQTRMAQGQGEANGVRSYLQELYDECYSLLPTDKNEYNQSVNLFNELYRKDSVVLLDIVTDGNNLLLRILAEEFKVLIRRGVPFYLILDDIAINDDNYLKNICTINANGFNYGIYGNDVYSLCGADDSFFSSVLGNSKKWFVFHHSSGHSAEKWSGAFSTYRRIQQTTTYGSGHTGHIGLFSSGMVSNRSTSYTDKQEAVIPAEEISRLTARGGIVYSADEREISIVDKFLQI